MHRVDIYYTIFVKSLQSSLCIKLKLKIKQQYLWYGLWKYRLLEFKKSKNAAATLSWRFVISECHEKNGQYILHLHQILDQPLSRPCIPTNTKHLYNICTMLDQRLRRSSNIVQMSYKCVVFAGMWLSVAACRRQMRTLMPDDVGEECGGPLGTRQGLIPARGWPQASVTPTCPFFVLLLSEKNETVLCCAKAGPTLGQHRVRVSCLLEVPDILLHDVNDQIANIT